MIWGIDYAIFFMILYLAIGAIGVGIWWEIQDEDERDTEELANATFIALFWGIFLAIAAAAGALWLASWVPRAPVKLVKHIIRERKRALVPAVRVVR